MSSFREETGADGGGGGGGRIIASHPLPVYYVPSERVCFSPEFLPSLPPPIYIPTRLESYLPGNESAYGSGSNVITTFFLSQTRKKTFFFFL